MAGLASPQDFDLDGLIAAAPDDPIQAASVPTYVGVPDARQAGRRGSELEDFARILNISQPSPGAWGLAIVGISSGIRSTDLPAPVLQYFRPLQRKPTVRLRRR